MSRGRAEAGAGPGEVVGGDASRPAGGSTGIELNTSTGAAARPAGREPARGPRRETGAKTRSPRARGRAAAAVPAHQALAAGELGDELHGGGAVVDHDDARARGVSVSSSCT